MIFWPKASTLLANNGSAGFSAEKYLLAVTVGTLQVHHVREHTFITIASRDWGVM